MSIHYGGPYRADRTSRRISRTRAISQRNLILALSGTGGLSIPIIGTLLALGLTHQEPAPPSHPSVAVSRPLPKTTAVEKSLPPEMKRDTVPSPQEAQQAQVELLHNFQGIYAQQALDLRAALALCDKTSSAFAPDICKPRIADFLKIIETIQRTPDLLLKLEMIQAARELVVQYDTKEEARVTEPSFSYPSMIDAITTTSGICYEQSMIGYFLLSAAHVDKEKYMLVVEDVYENGVKQNVAHMVLMVVQDDKAWVMSSHLTQTSIASFKDRGAVIERASFLESLASHLNTIDAQGKTKITTYVLRTAIHNGQIIVIDQDSLAQSIQSLGPTQPYTFMTFPKNTRDPALIKFASLFFPDRPGSLAQASSEAPASTPAHP